MPIPPAPISDRNRYWPRSRTRRFKPAAANAGYQRRDHRRGEQRKQDTEGDVEVTQRGQRLLNLDLGGDAEIVSRQPFPRSDDLDTAIVAIRRQQDAARRDLLPWIRSRDRLLHKQSKRTR